MYLLLFVACQGSDQKGGDGSADPLSLSLAEGNITLMANATVSTDTPASVVVQFWSDAVGPLQTAAVEISTFSTIPVLGLRGDTTYTMKAVATYADGSVGESAEATFTTGAIPTGLATWSVSGEGSPEEITLIGPAAVAPPPPTSDAPYLIGVDGEGEVVWYYDPEIDMTDARNRSVTTLDDGSLLVLLPTAFHIIAPDGTLLREITPFGVGVDVLHHDGTMMPNGNLLLITQESQYADVPVFGGTVEVVGDRILEVDPTDTIVWDWLTFDHLDTSRWPGELSQTSDERYGYADWTHTNAVSYVEDTDQVILSLRHQNWALAVDHTTGDVDWILGKDGTFTLASGEWFTSQHAVTLAGDRVLMYDNGNEKPAPYSRAVEYSLDLDAMTVSESWSWHPGVYTENLGDADRLDNGNLLICASGQREEGTVGRIAEVTPDGTVDWELDIESGDWVYRAARVQWAWPVE